MRIEQRLNLDTIINGDALTELKKLPDECVDCIITSPPYFGLRDYGVEGQIGLEPTLNEYLDKMLVVTAECKRVLKKTGTMWWDHGDSYGTGSGSGVRDGKQATNRGTQTNKGWQKNGKERVIGYEKCLLLQNFRLVIRMIDEQQWTLRNCLVWHKPNVMPSSAKDRFTVDYEPVFFFSKSKKYWFEQPREPLSPSTAEAIRKYEPFNLRVRDADKAKSFQYRASDEEKRDYAQEREYRKAHGLYGTTITPTGRDHNLMVNPSGRTKRCVWKVATQPFREAHFATFPEALIEPMVSAGCPGGGIVLDPFMGAGTVAVVAKKLKRHWLGIELKKEYCEMAERRIRATPEPIL